MKYYPKKKKGGLFGLIITGLLVSFLFSAIRHHLPLPKFPARSEAPTEIEEIVRPSQPDEVPAMITTSGYQPQERYSAAERTPRPREYYRDSYLLHPEAKEAEQ